jgi:hypothetical protein
MPLLPYFGSTKMLLISPAFAFLYKCSRLRGNALSLLNLFLYSFLKKNKRKEQMTLTAGYGRHAITAAVHDLWNPFGFLHIEK